MKSATWFSLRGIHSGSMDALCATDSENTYGPPSKGEESYYPAG